MSEIKLTKVQFKALKEIGEGGAEGIPDGRIHANTYRALEERGLVDHRQVHLHGSFWWRLSVTTKGSLFLANAAEAAK